ncbi:MAG: ComEC/Rec2 family competence protein, partial [Alphaproteobacteria bacterium]|nr:ComEC/Rec2 family competence protein [Alphaproteobacteria bacterium]
IFAIAMSLIYLLLSGANVPAVRAFVMTTVVFVGLMMGREAISMRTVAFAALVILLLEPYAILTAGFDMSFAAVVALVAFYEALQSQKKQSGKRFSGNIIYRYFLGVLLTTFVATLAVTPYTLYHFSSFSPYAILSNLLAAPLVAFVVMPLIFLSLLLLPLGWHIWPLKIAGFGFSGLNGLAREITTFPYADMVCRPLPLSGLILVTLGGLWLCLWTKKWRFFGVIGIALGFLSYAFASKPDVLYSADGLSVGIQKSGKELVIFSAKRKKFLFDAWAGDYQNVEVLSKAQSRPDIHVICDDKMCVWQDVFAFDLKGHLSLENVLLEPHKTEGGAVWLKNGKIKHVFTRPLKALKPWEKTAQ